MKLFPVFVCALLLAAGCKGREPGSATITSGSLRIGCDEAVLPVVQHEIEGFTQLYTAAHLSLRTGEARALVADFAADSIETIVCARQMNEEEKKALAAAKISVQEYLVARSAVAVVANPDVPVSRLRVGQLDTIFSGGVTRWPGSRPMMIELAVCGLNSSVNEVFRQEVLHGGGFDPAAKPFDSSKDLLEYVIHTRGAAGIIGLNWLVEGVDSLRVMGLSSPAMRPDSTFAPEEYYTPHPGYVYEGYYPVNAPVYIYTRDIEQDVSMGFIAYVSSVAGQKIIQNDGLVPATMPVRIVHLTSHQIN